MRYIEHILQAAPGLFPKGEVTDIHVQHDAWCNQLINNGACNCEPDVFVETPEGRQRIDGKPNTN